MKGRIAEGEGGGIARVLREDIGQADFYIQPIGEAIVETNDQVCSATLTDSQRTCRTGPHLVSKVIIVAVEKNTLHGHFDRAVTLGGKPSLGKQARRNSQKKQERCTWWEQEPGRSWHEIHADYFFASSLDSSRLAFISIASSRTDKYAADFPGVFSTT